MNILFPIETNLSITELNIIKSLLEQLWKNGRLQGKGYAHIGWFRFGRMCSALHSLVAHHSVIRPFKRQFINVTPKINQKIWNTLIIPSPRVVVNASIDLCVRGYEILVPTYSYTIWSICFFICAHTRVFVQARHWHGFGAHNCEWNSWRRITTASIDSEKI